MVSKSIVIALGPLFSFALAVGAAGCAADVQTPQTNGGGGATSIDPGAEMAHSGTAPTFARRVQPASTEAPAQGAALHAVDQDGHEVKPLTEAEARTLALTLGGELAAPRLDARGNGGAKIGRVTVNQDAAYGCNSWMNDGDVVSCGSWFFGNTSIYMVNCSPSWGIFMRDDGNYYAIQPMPNPWTCSTIDFSGWYWGAYVNFYDVYTTPLYVTH